MALIFFGQTLLPAAVDTLLLCLFVFLCDFFGCRDAGLHAFRVKIWLPGLLSPRSPHLVPLKPESPQLEQVPTPSLAFSIVGVLGFG